MMFESVDQFMRQVFLLFCGFYSLGFVLLLIQPAEVFATPEENLVMFTFLNTLIFSAVIVLYTSTIAVKFREHLDHSEVKDSPYFMGFLFTLTALVVSFSTISNIEGIVEGEQNSQNFADEIGVVLEAPVAMITQAGIALITSIIGILCRYFLIFWFPNGVTIEPARKDASEENRLKNSNSEASGGFGGIISLVMLILVVAGVWQAFELLLEIWDRI